MSKTVDVKVGYSCNNNCRHCVIHDNKEACIRNNVPIDTSYAELIGLFKSKEFIEADTAVITGGEPTIRKDFMRLVRYIVSNYPNKHICLQTNGRKLINYLEEIKSITSNISYVIALHGTEDVHNIVTNNENVSELNNPFRETMATIDKISALYGEFDSVARIEIVLTKLNLSNMAECVDGLLGRNINRIGISYPHMDGMCLSRPDEASKLCFSYSELAPILRQLKDIRDKYEKSAIYFEEVPQCMFRDKNGKVYYDKGFCALGHNIPQVNVKFPSSELSYFADTYVDMHKYSNKCPSCVLYKKQCLGTWEESIRMFGSEGFEPIMEV